MIIRSACTGDHASIWSIIGPIIRAGNTYALAQGMSEAAALAYWLGADKDPFVAGENGAILGTCYMRPNQAGGGPMSVIADTWPEHPRRAEAWPGNCVSIHSRMRGRPVIAPCSSTSLSAPTNGRCVFGNRWVLRSSALR